VRTQILFTVEDASAAWTLKVGRGVVLTGVRGHSSSSLSGAEVPRSDGSKPFQPLMSIRRGARIGFATFEVAVLVHAREHAADLWTLHPDGAD